jgi:hypothetical protein
MAVEFFPESIAYVEARVAALYDAAVDATGEPLFPDHRVPGTPGYNLRRITERLMLQHYRESNLLFSAMSPRTAEGLALDGWGEFFDWARKGSKPSAGTVVVQAQQTGQVLAGLFGTREIPAGTRFTAGAMTLRTTETAAIPEAGRSVSVAVEADGVAKTSRLSVGTRLQFASEHPLRAVVLVETTTDIAGGKNTETDDQFRYRLVRALRDPSTYEGFEAALLAHSDVDRVELFPGRYGAGTVEAFVSPAIAFPPPTLRDELEAIWQGPGRAYVVTPDYEAVALRIRVAGGTGLAPIVVDLVNNLDAGDTVVLAQIEAALLSAGASDAQVIQIRRGSVDEDGQIVGAYDVASATNLSPRSSRSKWYTRTDWITLCS